MEKHVSKVYFLSHKLIVTLFVIYIFFIMVGLVMSIVGILHESFIIASYPILLKAIIGSFGISLIGSSIFYSRKLYKHSIHPDISFPLTEKDKLQQIGIFMYFLLRPLFSICFSLLIIIGFKVSIIIISVEDETLNSGFIYLTMFLSFFAGFSSGDILSVLEEIGKRKMERFFESQD